MDVLGKIIIGIFGIGIISSVKILEGLSDTIDKGRRSVKKLISKKD